MGTGTLNWYADRGFELDVEAAEDDVAIRLAAVPVPADGTDELREGVDLDRLDILFKASVEIQGELAQLQDARVQLVREGGKYILELDAKCEDVETGEIVPLRLSVPISVPSGVPERGGPRPVPTNEDDLDWEDETTLEQLVNAPEAPITDIAGADVPGPGPGSRPAVPRAATLGKGQQALLEAMARIDDDLDEPSSEVDLPAGELDDEDDDDLDDLDGPDQAPVPGANRRVGSDDDDEDAAEGPDQSLGADGEAKSLLDLLVDGGNLELEGDAEVDGLVTGVAKILAATVPAEVKATRLSQWLLQQEEVADLFIADDDLAEILERW